MYMLYVENPSIPKLLQQSMLLAGSSQLRAAPSHQLMARLGVAHPKGKNHQSRTKTELDRTNGNTITIVVATIPLSSENQENRMDGKGMRPAGSA